MNSIKFLYSAVVIALTLSCTTAHKTTAGIAEEKIQNVAYGPSERNRMDVYLPANRTASTPFVLLIHGGAWVMAGKEYISEFRDSLFNHGIAVASINHRYANNTDIHYPQMMQDIDQAVNYCLSHAKEWKIKNKGIVMAGVSSGGHLALLYAYTTSNKINAIVEFCAPTNLTDTATLQYSVKVGLIDVIQKMTGKIYVQDQSLPAEFGASSPIMHIKNIPILIAHGTADRVVNFSQSQQLSDKLEEKKIIHKLIPIPGADHDVKDPAAKSMIYHEAIAWVLKYGK